MKALVEQVLTIVRQTTGICLLWGLFLTQAFAVIAVEPAVIAPDDDGVVRFSVSVSGVPEPGFRSYALSMRFGGAAINLVNSINSITAPPPADAVSCAAVLRLGASSETIVPGFGVILESGQGAFVLDSVGGGTLLATDNRIVDATTAQYNVGVAGETGVVTPQIGAGSLIDFLCYVGASVPDGTTITVTPGLYPGLDGAIFLDESGSLPIDSTFNAGAIQVGPATDPPLLNPIGDKTVNEGDLLSFLVTASDPNDDALSFTATGLPVGATFVDNGDGTGTFNWTPEFDQAGTYTVTFEVTEDTVAALTDSETITITVTDVVLQQPPVANDDAVSTLEDTPLTIDVLANDSDPNEDTLSILGVVQPANGTVVNNGLDVTYTPNLNFNGVETFSYSIDDGNGGTDSATVTVTVDPVNDPPVLIPLSDLTVLEGDFVSLLVTASDLDGDDLVLTVTGLPAGAVFVDNGDGTGTFSWTPSAVQAGDYQVTFTAADNGVPSLSDSQTLKITVTEGNLPPILEPIGDQVVAEGQLLEFSLNATDPNGDPVSFSAADLPLGSELIDNGDGTATFKWTPELGQAGDYLVTFMVTDAGDPPLTDSETITITVLQGNQAPVLDPVGNQAINEEQLLSFEVIATDPDGDTLILAAANLPTGATFIDNADGTGTFSWMPSFDQAGNYTVLFTVTDDGSPAMSDSEEITITVGDVNRPPELEPIGAQTSAEGDLLTLLVTATDPDGDNLVFSVAGLPTGAEFTDNGDGTADFSWVPDFGQAGVYDVSFTVTDDGLPVEGDAETITITVGDVNQPPVLDPIGNRSVNEGELLEIPVTASDPDGDGLTLHVTNLPTGGLFTDNGDGTGLFSWTPDFDQAGNYDVAFTVTDDGVPAESDAETITITVGVVNRPPVLDPIGNRSVNEGEFLEIVLTASDPDGDGLSFSATNPPTGALFVDNGDGTALFSWTPDFGQAGNYAVSFTVTDDGLPAESDAETITITVGDVNRPPVLDPIGNHTIGEGELLEFVLTASDPDGDGLVYGGIGLPVGALFTDNGDGTAIFSWTPELGQAGTYDVTFTVTDDGSPAESDFEAISITVADSGNRPPALDLIGDQTVNVGELLELQLTASDAEGDNLTFSVSGLPAGADFVDYGDGTASLSWIPTADQVGTHEVTVLVTDDGIPSLTDAEIFTITVEGVTENLPPVLDPIGEKTVTVGEVLSFGVSASDPNGDNLSLTAANLPPGASFADNGDGTASFSWAPTSDQVGEYEVTFTVTDGGLPALSDSEEVEIEVVVAGAVPEAPENLKALRIWRYVLMGWESSEGATHYVVYRRLSYEKDFTVIGEPTWPLFTDYIPRRARSAEYYVVAVNEYGVSEPSNTLEIVLRVRRR